MVFLSQQSRTRLLPQRQLAVLLLLLSLLAAHTVAARVLQQREDIDIRQHSKRRSLQQSSIRPGPGVMFAGTTVQPATPLARLNEELPQGVLMTSSDVDTVTISLILKGKNPAFLHQCCMSNAVSCNRLAEVCILHQSCPPPLLLLSSMAASTLRQVMGKPTSKGYVQGCVS